MQAIFMHLGLTALSTFFRDHNENEALVLATVISTAGSTYRKPGAMMLISREGQHAGMISGGCLESDVMEHATTVFETGKPAHVTYDMYADEKLVWGLGLGCDGVINLLLQRLDREQQFGFLPELFALQDRRLHARLALVTHSNSGIIPAGSGLLVDSTGQTSGYEMLLPYVSEGGFPEGCRQVLQAIEIGDDDAEILLVDIPPPPKVLICGAGPDAIPFAKLITDLGWECLVTDYRSHYARSGRFPAAVVVTHTPAGTLDTSAELSDVDAAVIMSHHLENDFHYLQACLSIAGIKYVGILGPAARREKLLARIEINHTVVFGPVGLDIGAELPESIALSAVAEIHAVLNQRDGGSLTK